MEKIRTGLYGGSFNPIHNGHIAIARQMREKAGLEEVWKGVEEYLDHIQRNGYFQHNRNRQNKYWMYETINEALRSSFYRDPAVEGKIADYEQRVLDDKISSFVAAKELLDLYFKAGLKNRF